MYPVTFCKYFNHFTQKRRFGHYQALKTRIIFSTSSLIGAVPFTTLAKGVKTTSPFTTPAITCVVPSNRAFTAAWPSLLANILSAQLGEPPLCICPSMQLRTSNAGKRATILYCTSFAPPKSSPSATTIMCTDFFLRSSASIRHSTSLISVSVSGIRISSAPQAMPLCSAM